MSANNITSFSSKFEDTAPYHFFLTTVQDEPDTSSQPFSVTFNEIIDRSLGELVDCLLISRIVNVPWIASEFAKADQKPRTTVIYVSYDEDDVEYDSDSDYSEPDLDNLNLPFDIEFEKVVMPLHQSMRSKIMIFKYVDDKIRLVISSANLKALEWKNRTNGLWISPLLPLLPNSADDVDGDSPTNFKRDFIEYLSEHREPQVFGWLSLLHRIDFSAIKVFFWGSVPGYYESDQCSSWGRHKISKILSEHVVMPENSRDWPIVTQTGNFGWVGPTYHGWLAQTIQAMSKEKGKRIIFIPELKLIHSSKKNNLMTYDHQNNQVVYLYQEYFHRKQPWIKDYMYQWKSDKIKRTRAAPHLNCYTRMSPDCTEISWFAFSSCGLLRRSWGKTIWDNKTFGPSKPKLCIARYEAGIIFIPKFLINRDTFPVSERTASDVPKFLLPFDVPLTLYESDDEPHCRPLEYSSAEILKDIIKMEEAGNDEIDEVSLDESGKYSYVL